MNNAQEAILGEGAAADGEAEPAGDLDLGLTKKKKKKKPKVHSSLCLSHLPQLGAVHLKGSTRPLAWPSAGKPYKLACTSA